MGVPLKDIFTDELLKRFSLKLKAGGEGLSRILSSSRIQKPGLLLTGLLEELHSDRVQILGQAEIGYLKNLAGRELDSVISLLEKSHFPAIIITKDLTAPDFLYELSRKKKVPLYTTSLTSSIFIEGFTKCLEELLAPSITMHGVLVDVLGVGILIIGKSGIGKSECALDLVSRGYRLVSDDVVAIKRMPPSVLFGSSLDLNRYYMEIRGLGIVNIKDLYGITAIRKRKQMDLVVELVKWEPEGDYERLGIEDKSFDILDVPLPYLRVPVTPGRSVATIVEVAARNQILKIMGQYSARAFAETLDGAITRPSKDKVTN